MYSRQYHPVLPVSVVRLAGVQSNEWNTGRSHNCSSPFSAKLKCGDCGEYFGSKVWHSNSKYRRTVWQCNAKFKGESRCATPHLYEQRIKELFLEAAGILMEKREEIIGDCQAVMEALADCGSIETEMEVVSSEMEELPVDFDERLFHRLVDYATVYSDGSIMYQSFIYVIFPKAKSLLEYISLKKTR